MISQLYYRSATCLQLASIKYAQKEFTKRMQREYSVRKLREERERGYLFIKNMLL